MPTFSALMVARCFTKRSTWLSKQSEQWVAGSDLEHDMGDPKKTVESGNRETRIYNEPAWLKNPSLWFSFIFYVFFLTFGAPEQSRHFSRALPWLPDLPHEGQGLSTHLDQKVIFVLRYPDNFGHLPNDPRSTRNTSHDIGMMIWVSVLAKDAQVREVDILKHHWIQWLHIITHSSCHARAHELRSKQPDALPDFVARRWCHSHPGQWGWNPLACLPSVKPPGSLKNHSFTVFGNLLCRGHSNPLFNGISWLPMLPFRPPVRVRRSDVLHLLILRSRERAEERPRQIRFHLCLACWIIAQPISTDSRCYHSLVQLTHTHTHKMRPSVHLKDNQPIG